MDELRERARAFCRNQAAPRPMQREIHEMVREDMHASYGWYRIFPQQGERRRLLPVHAPVRESADAARPPGAEVGGAG